MIDRDTLVKWHGVISHMSVVLERELERTDPSRMTDPTYVRMLRETYEEQGKIAAIKYFRQRWGVSLLEAKNQVDEFAEIGGWKKPLHLQPWGRTG